MVLEMKVGWVEKGGGIQFVLIFPIRFHTISFYLFIFIYVFLIFFLGFFFVVGKYEVKACCTREFRGERHNQG